MSSKVKNSIPKACRENWLELSGDEKNKFCNLCQKNVFDTDTDENQNDNIECLRYGSTATTSNKKTDLITKISNLFQIKNRAKN